MSTSDPQDSASGEAGFAEGAVLDACGFIPSGPCSPFAPEPGRDDR